MKLTAPRARRAHNACSKPAVLAIAAVVVTLAWGILPVAHAQGTQIGGIYTCKDQYGRTITSDRPIVECAETGQRVLNPDGSTKSVILTPAQQKALDAEKRKRAEEADREAERRRKERIMLQRYPNEASWEKQAFEALMQPYQAIEDAQKRMLLYDKTAKSLADEAEFYKGKRLPVVLRRQIEENQFAIDAEKRLIEAKRAEARVIQQRVSAELIELRRLWATKENG
jgi:hypothetical protein